MLSVIIPTLNEAADLPRTLAHTRAAAGREAIEVIVSDCCSEDDTRRVAAERGALLIEGSLSRAQALNRGAAAAGGTQLLFLHADTLLPSGFAAAVRQTLERPEMVGGAFSFRFFRPPRTTSASAPRAISTATRRSSSGAASSRAWAVFPSDRC